MHALVFAFALWLMPVGTVCDQIAESDAAVGSEWTFSCADGSTLVVAQLNQGRIAWIDDPQGNEVGGQYSGDSTGFLFSTVNSSGSSATNAAQPTRLVCMFASTFDGSDDPPEEVRL